MSKNIFKYAKVDDFTVLNPYSFKYCLSVMNEKNYLSCFKLKDFFTEIIKLYLNCSNDDKAQFFEEKLLPLIKQRMPISKNYQFIANSLFQRYLFLKNLTSIFSIESIGGVIRHDRARVLSIRAAPLQ
jgi:hypothetical protein